VVEWRASPRGGDPQGRGGPNRLFATEGLAQRRTPFAAETACHPKCRLALRRKPQQRDHLGGDAEQTGGAAPLGAMGSIDQNHGIDPAAGVRRGAELQVWGCTRSMAAVRSANTARGSRSNAKNSGGVAPRKADSAMRKRVRIPGQLIDTTTGAHMCPAHDARLDVTAARIIRGERRSAPSKQRQSRCSARQLRSGLPNRPPARSASRMRYVRKCSPCRQSRAP